MIKVKNKQVIAHISKKSLQSNRLRNMVAILAIALTSLLFTSLFTIGGGLLKTTEISTCRMVGTSSHAGYKNLTEAEYETLKNSSLIKEQSYNIFLAMADNEALWKEKVELRYGESQDAKWSFSYPKTGTMPVKYDDVAMSTIVLDALGVPHEIGQSVSLQYTVNGTLHTDTFRLCGYWQGDSALPAQEVWLSKQYVADVVSIPKNHDKENDNSDGAGYISCNFKFNNTWNLDEKLKTLTAKCGFDQTAVDGGVNWAYMSSEVDVFSVLLAVVVFALIFLSGYLIIYNVFYISVTRDIRYYGLLKTIGMTGKQLKRLVRRQSLILALPGIAIGLVLGWGVGVAALPMIMVSTYFEGETVVSANPLIFVGAALFSLLTVRISCNRPAYLAAKVSPMEALHMQEQSKHTKIRIRKAKKVTIYAMAVQNVFRNKKKVVVVVTSLALSLILLNVTYGTIKSFDMKKYLKHNVVADFNLANAKLQNRYELSYLDDESVSKITTLKGIDKVGRIYMQEGENQLTDQAAANLKKIKKQYSDVMDDFVIKTIESTLNTGTLPSHIYGINDVVLHKMTLQKGKMDWDKFSGGDYVITTPFAEGLKKATYEPGEKVTIDFGNGKTKEYTVMAVMEFPYALSCMHSHGTTGEFFLPKEEYLNQSDELQPMRLVFDVQEKYEAQLEKQIENICGSTNMDYVSRAKEVQNFEQNQHKYMIVGGFLAIVLAIIGILNFLNSMLTSIYARKQELAMLQSVGMTTKQMRKMLILEGTIYAMITLGIVLTVGNVASYMMIQMLAGIVWYYTYYFSVLPILCCIPLLLFVVILVPMIGFYNVQKQSVVERLRQAE